MEIFNQTWYFILCKYLKYLLKSLFFMLKPLLSNIFWATFRLSVVNSTENSSGMGLMCSSTLGLPKLKLISCKILWNYFL